MTLVGILTDVLGDLRWRLIGLVKIVTSNELKMHGTKTIGCSTKRGKSSSLCTSGSWNRSWHLLWTSLHKLSRYTNKTKSRFLTVEAISKQMNSNSHCLL